MAAEPRRLTTTRPKISVVVASQNARASIGRCLGSLVAQCPGENIEVVVVDNSTDGTTEIIQRQFPSLRLITRPPSALIPELWEVGILASAGEIVSLTTAHCVPHETWLAAVRKAHESPAAGIGGAIENDEAGRLVDWAVYFCRYSRYMLPFRERLVPDIAADNASYQRASIDQCRRAWLNGFWEPAVHAALKKAGFSLRVVPSVVVYHQHSFGLRGFIQQRFRHGVQFGRERAGRLGAAKRALYIALSPLVPLLFLVRIGREVRARRRHGFRFLLASPLLILFLLSWASGELVGYLLGPQYLPASRPSF